MSDRVLDNAGRIRCELCLRYIQPRGIGTHRKACVAKANTRAQDDQYLRTVMNETSSRSGQMGSYGAVPASIGHFHADYQRDPATMHGSAQAEAGSYTAQPAHSTGQHQGSAEVDEPVNHALADGTEAETSNFPVYEEILDPLEGYVQPEWDPPVDPKGEFAKVASYKPGRNAELRVGDIMTVYHPHSGLPTTISHRKDYKPRAEIPPAMANRLDTDPEGSNDRRPWHPFTELLDFEFAEIAMEAHLSQGQIDRLLRIIWDVAKGEKKKPNFTLRSHQDLANSWDRASVLQAQFKQHEITVPYLRVNYTYDLHTRPIWDWVMDQLRNPRIIQHMHWDARRLFTYDGNQWVGFINEPFTACRSWNIQSRLPGNAKPLGLIVYADKTKLSSFGTLKGYPVMMSISNLAKEIRNGVGIGGTRIVGWLPIVAEDAEHKGKTTFTNFKRVVWHESFRVILSTIAGISQTGFRALCGDKIERILFPFVHILVSDYEEQCIMALTRGVNSAEPCNVCHVRADQQTKLRAVAPRRTALEALKIVLDPTLNKTQKEALLKPFSLRDVANAFWIVANSDPHDAFAVDRLHVGHGGCEGDHMWPELQDSIEKVGRNAIGQVDKQMSMLPRWRNINHFKSVMRIHFTDGRKYEDISKFIVYAAHNVLTPENSPGGYRLLRCMRAYVEHDMYLALEQHTDETLAAGYESLLKFGSLIDEYTAICPSKDWNFPKYHANKHGYYDIADKGITANFNTKGYEKHHGPAKDFVNLEGNKRDPEKQVLRGEHRALVALNLRAEINIWLEERNALSSEEAAEPKLEAFQFGHIYIGSRDKPCSLAILERSHSDDSAFRDLPTRLNTFINENFCFPLGLPRVRFQPTDLIIECHYLKVDFESTVTWTPLTDYLRCSPRFHGHIRNDGVIFQAEGNHVRFGQLLAIFVCKISEDAMEPIALVLPMDRPVGPRLKKDEELSLNRLQARGRHLCEFVSVRKIIRGAFLAPAYDKPDNFFAVDVVDTDMFLRLKTLFRY